MNYNEFLILLSNVSLDHVGQFEVSGAPYPLQLSKWRGGWRLMMKLHDSIVNQIRTGASGKGTYRWISQGPYIQLDDASAWMVEDFSAIQGYRSFKQRIDTFVTAAADWL